MSAGTAIPRSVALMAAEKLVRALWSGCERIEIAGSLRRCKPQVHDIEIVAVARFGTMPDGLFGSIEVDALEHCIAAMLADDSRLAARAVENKRADGSIDVGTKLGPAFKALVFHDIPVDLFIVRPPASWGVIYGLRTGPGDWNTRLVTECKNIGRRVSGGRVERWASPTSSWVAVPTPEEADFFAALGQPWVEPAERRVERVAISRSVATVPA